MRHWYVIYSKPQKELFLFQQLSLYQINTYIPLVFNHSRNTHKTKPKDFFPCYLFVQLDIQDKGLSNLLWIPGSRGVVCYGDEPSEVPDAFIEQLKMKIDTINHTPLNSCSYYKGQNITISSGLFKGYSAVFDEYLPEKDRVQLLLKTIEDFNYRVEIPAIELSGSSV
jgi:transcriptional antiterminator RfaH